MPIGIFRQPGSIQKRVWTNFFHDTCCQWLCHLS